MPFCVEGAAPGTRVVTARVIVDFEGPREIAPPQLSERFCVDASAVRVGSKPVRRKGLNARAEASDGIARRKTLLTAHPNNHLYTSVLHSPHDPRLNANGTRPPSSIYFRILYIYDHSLSQCTPCRVETHQ
ncbi:hypothetical protein M3J09_013201 [Ascochyta lentis]